MADDEGSHYVVCNDNVIRSFGTSCLRMTTQLLVLLYNILVTQILHLAKVIITNDKSPVFDGALLILNSKIEKVGRKSDFGNIESSNFRIIDHGDSLICPGFINLHTHLAYTALGFVEEDKGLFPWLEELVNGTKDWSEEDYRKSIQTGIEMVLSSGTTFIVENTPKPYLSAEEISKSKLKALIGIEVFGSDEKKADEIFEGALDMHMQLNSRFPVPNFQFTFSPHAPYDVSKKLWEKLVLWSTRNNKLLLTHIEESRQETSWWQKKSGESINFWKKIGKLESKLKYWKKYDSGIDFLFKNGLLNKNLLGAHLTCGSKTDLLRLKEEGVRLIHCPRSNFYLNNGIADLRLWKELGLVWGIGTDSLASSKSLDLLEELRFAINQQKLIYNYKLNEEKAFELITLNAAKVLGIENEVGTLKKGAKADFLIYNIKEETNSNPYYLIIWEIGNKEGLKEVWINGEVAWQKVKVFQ